MYKVRLILDHVNLKLQNVYTAEEYLTNDEALSTFCGHILPGVCERKAVYVWHENTSII
jgi:hypothetical protein